MGRSLGLNLGVIAMVLSVIMWMVSVWPGTQEREGERWMNSLWLDLSGMSGNVTSHWIDNIPECLLWSSGSPPSLYHRLTSCMSGLLVK